MYYVGVDIGGTSIKAGVVSDDGTILYKSVKATIKNSETEFLKQILEIIEAVLGQLQLTYQDIESIGIGCPGIIDSEKGVIFNLGNIGISDYPLKERLEELLPVPVLVNNDANCAALGEYHALKEKKIKSFVMLTLGTGIGGGIIIDHKIYTGYDGSAGEFGNMIINVAGQRVWWEEYASARALVRMAEAAAMKYKDSILYDLIDKSNGKANGEMVFSALRQKDKVTEAVFEDYIKYLGDGIISILYIFRPEVISIGGGISQADLLWEPLMKYVADNSNWKKRERKTQICRAVLGNDAGIIGAAFLQKYV